MILLIGAAAYFMIVAIVAFGLGAMFGDDAHALIALGWPVSVPLGLIMLTVVSVITVADGIVSSGARAAERADARKRDKEKGMKRETK